VSELEAYERRFRRAGLPLFIEGYSAREDIWTRAAPLLALVFLGETLGATQLDWPLAANVAAVAGGLAIVLGAFGTLNIARGRPFWSLPHQIRPAELAAFVLIPAALPLIFGGQVGSAALTVAFNLVLLGLAYVVVGYGLIGIIRWTAPRLLEQLAASVAVLSRAVPLLMVFALVLFVNTEMWQVFSRMPDVLLVLVYGLFVGVGSLFCAVRLPRVVAELEREAGADGPPLDRRERVNVGLVLFVGQGMQVLVVSVAVTLFFVLFGALAIGPDVRESWDVVDGAVLLSLDLFGEPIAATEALLRVSGGIGAFSGVYYAIAVLTDSTYRGEFLEELTGEMRDTFNERAEYLRAREAAATA